MKNEALYNKTVEILVQAYLNDTLEAADCRACAVGNIVAGNLGLNIKRQAWGYRAEGHVEGDPLKDVGLWFSAINCGQVNLNALSESVLKQCAVTGYSPDELCKIEDAFMMNCMPKNVCSDSNFNGLMAVIDVLDQIHENADATQTLITKQRFTKVNS